MRSKFFMVYLLSVMTVIPFASDAKFGCNVLSEKQVELDTSLPLDFTARTLLKRIQGRHNTLVHWHDGTQEKAQLVIEYKGGAIRYVEQAFDDGGTGQEIALPCYNQLELDVVMRLELQKSGRIEEFSTTFKAPNLEMITQYLEVDIRAASKSVLIAAADQSRIESGQAHLVIESEILDDGLHGELSILQSEEASSNAADASVQLHKKRLAHWVVHGL